MTTADDRTRIPPEFQIATTDIGAENAIDEFVDMFNARDIDELVKLISPDIDAEFLKVAGVANMLEGVEDLFVRQPYVIATRGELGVDPVAALWRPCGSDGHGFVVVGYLVFEWSEDDEPLITRIEYFEELEDVLVEVPDEIVEGLDWEIADLD